jgi:hypothetical protein
MRIRTKNKFIIWIFSKVWYNWMTDSFTSKKMKIIEVRGYRTVLWDSPSGCRTNSTFCPKWIPERFH